MSPPGRLQPLNHHFASVLLRLLWQDRSCPFQTSKDFLTRRKVWSRRPGARARGKNLRWAMWALLFGGAGVAAQTPPPVDHFRYTAWAGFDYTDNRQRSRSDGTSDLLFAPGFSYSVLHSGRRWRLRGEGELRLERKGLDDGVDPRARAALMVDFALLPQRLYWNLQDFAEVQSVDPQAPNDPSNRQQTNLLQTGPILLLGSPSTYLARIEAQVARADAERTPDFDHRRHLLSAWVTRQTDPVQSWAAGLESTAVDFQRGFGVRDFQRDDLLLRHQRELPRGAFAVTLGYSSIDPQVGARLSRPLAHIKLRYSPNISHEFGTLVRYELSDAGRELSQERNPLDPFRYEARRALIGTDLYRLAAVDASWKWQGVKTQLRLNAFGRDYDYLRSGPQALESSRGLQLGLTRELTPLTRIHANAASERFAFVDSARSDRDNFFSVGYERDLNPRWKLRAGLARQQRSSNLAVAEYAENSASLYLIYTGGR